MIHIDKIEAFFLENGFPDYDVEILQGVKVKAENSKQFIENSISTLRKHKGNKGYYPYYFHLQHYFKIVYDRLQAINKTNN